jgi:hypothetical protein
VSGRLAALSLARDPGYAGAAAAFLLVSVGLAAFSLDYRSTLTRSQADQAAFATPAAAVLRAGPGEMRSLADPRLAAAYGVKPTPVLRFDAQVGTGAATRAVTVLGVPAATIARPPFWRGDFAASSPRALAAAVDPGDAALRGVRLPRDATTLRLGVRLRGYPLRIVASIETRGGEFESFELSHEGPVLHGHVPRAARGGLLVGFGIGPTQAQAHNARPSNGTLVLGPLSAAGPSGSRVLERDFDDWIGTGGIRGSGRRVGYFISNAGDAAFRPRQRTDEAHVAAIASPALARTVGTGGLLPIRFADQTLVVRVAAVARRFPSLYGAFVVADQAALATALNADDPGSAVTNEAWLRSAPAGLAHAVGRPPLDGLRATFRSDVEARLRADPLARAVLWTLAGLALVGFGLALAGLAVAVTADLRDERGELFDLEAQGARPSALRRHVRLRSGGVLALGVLGGVALAAVLSVLVVDVVLVTANGRLPEPPLILDVDWPIVLAGLAAYLVFATGLVSLATRRALR